MYAPISLTRALIIAGLVGMVLGAIDPLEGAFVILPSVALVAIGVFISKSRCRALLMWSLGLVAIGVAAMVVLSWLGGIGGPGDLSIWWGVFILSYPIGWAMGLVGAIVALVDSTKAQRTSAAQ